MYQESEKARKYLIHRDFLIDPAVF